MVYEHQLGRKCLRVELRLIAEAQELDNQYALTSSDHTQ